MAHARKYALSKSTSFSSVIVFPSPSTHLAISHDTSRHRSGRSACFLHFRVIRYRCPSLIPIQDVRQRIRHRVHRCRCIRHHPHGGRSDQEGRVSFAISPVQARFISCFHFCNISGRALPVSNQFGTMTHKRWTDHASGHRRADGAIGILDNQCALLLISRSRTRGR